MTEMSSNWENECESCIEGKTSRRSHQRHKGRRTNRIMELWHTDLIESIKPSTFGKKNYILTVIDDYSRMIFIQLLSEKIEPQKN